MWSFLPEQTHFQPPATFSPGFSLPNFNLGSFLTPPMPTQSSFGFLGLPTFHTGFSLPQFPNLGFNLNFQPSQKPTQSTPSAGYGNVTAAGPSHAQQYLPLIRQVAAEEGVPADVIAAIMDTENSGETATSPAGAYGLMQVVGDHSATPLDNIRAGARVLKQKYDMVGGDWDKAAAAYYGAWPNLSATDGSSVTGYDYIRRFQTARANYIDRPQVLTSDTAQGPSDDAHPGRPTQFAPGLSYEDQLAACGPAAAAGIMAYLGQPVSVAQAMTTAKQYQYWAGQMKGIDSEVSLINTQAGRNVVHAEGMDWNRVNQEILAGRPVIVDTPGHYYYIDGVNNGSYHVGTSGKDLRGGSEWMTPQQMSSLMGATRGIITLNG